MNLQAEKHCSGSKPTANHRNKQHKSQRVKYAMLFVLVYFLQSTEVFVFLWKDLDRLTLHSFIKLYFHSNILHSNMHKGYLILVFLII